MQDLGGAGRVAKSRCDTMTRPRKLSNDLTREVTEWLKGKRKMQLMVASVWASVLWASGLWRSALEMRRGQLVSDRTVSTILGVRQVAVE